MIATLFLMAASAPSTVNRIEPLIAQPAKVARKADDPPEPADPLAYCTVDKHWCAQLSRDVDLDTVTLLVFDGTQPEDGRDTARYPIAVDVSAMGAPTMRLWPMMIREAIKTENGEAEPENASIGVIQSSSSMYSGGGGHAEWLSLFRLQGVRDGKPIVDAVLGVPLSGNILIRACFSEKDYADRSGACHDEYNFDAALIVDPRSKTAPPRLVYRTIATNTPGASSRSTDNSGLRFSKADLKPTTDKICTYRRFVNFNPATRHYEFDRPGPDCSEYTVP
jgi:hypothetical protein